MCVCLFVYRWGRGCESVWVGERERERGTKISVTVISSKLM